MRVLYATDMDRTLIYSKRFLDEYPTKTSCEVAEMKDDRIISYISSPVKKRIKELRKNNNLIIVPVTTRSISEFNRIDLGIDVEYAIVSNGGTILNNGEPLEEWEDYIRKNVNSIELMDCMMDLDEFTTIERPTKVIDNKYLFNKVEDGITYDLEVANLINKYPNLSFVRQRNKVYVIPKAFSKAIALRWLQNKLGAEKLLASGDSQLDLPMLAIANYAIIPKHGDLVKSGYVTDGRLIEEGINSPMYTFDILEELINN